MKDQSRERKKLPCMGESGVEAFPECPFISRNHSAICPLFSTSTEIDGEKSPESETRSVLQSSFSVFGRSHLKESSSPSVFNRLSLFQNRKELLIFVLERGKKIFEAEEGFLFERNGKGKDWALKSKMPEVSELVQKLPELLKLNELIVPRAIQVEEKGLEAIVFPIYSGGDPSAVLAFSSGKAEWARKHIHQAYIYFREINWACESLKTKKKLERANYEAAMALWQAVYAREPSSALHLRKTEWLGKAFARRLGLMPSEEKILLYGLLLHDIGKIGVPESVLNKPGPLTDEEWELVKLHPQIGAKIIQPFSSLREAIPLVLYHHERWDGKGYPKGLKGKRIPFMARVVSVIDAYQAMRADRPYRSALSVEKALAELRKESGRQFDPEIISKFLPLGKRLQEAENFPQRLKKQGSKSLSL